MINIYASNIGAPKHIKQILTDIKRENDGNTIIVGDFNIPFTSMDRSSRQKINKATEILKKTIEKLDLINIFRVLQPKKKSEYIFFLCAHGTFARIHHILGHKANLNKFKSIEITSSIFEHNGMKLEINHRKKMRTD